MNTDKLVMLWTTGDKEVATNMVMMYALNSKIKGWWEDITLLIWGPSARLLCEDEDLQRELAALKEQGIKLLACRRCADQYGIAQKLEGMGVEVVYAGEILTGFIKENYKILSV